MAARALAVLLVVLAASSLALEGVQDVVNAPEVHDLGNDDGVTDLGENEVHDVNQAYVALSARCGCRF